MEVALLGAAGFVGSARLDEALLRGHTVTALARHPEKLGCRDRLVGVSGDGSSLGALIQGPDAVISAFNPGWENPHLFEDQVRGTSSIIAALKRVGIKRVLWVGGAGGQEVAPGVRVVDGPDFPDWVKPGSLASRSGSLLSCVSGRCCPRRSRDARVLSRDWRRERHDSGSNRGRPGLPRHRSTRRA